MAVIIKLNAMMFLLYFLCAVNLSESSLLRVKKMINGIETDHSESTWLVSMQGKLVTETFLGIPISYNRVYCGGTLISDRWVLTAAHCFKGEGTNPKNWHARFASKNLSKTGHETLLHLFGKVFDIDSLKQMEYHPDRIVIHPSYNSGGLWSNDIALVRLKETVPLNIKKRVSVVRLAEGNETHSVECSAYGWGCASLGSSVTETIQKINLAPISDEECFKEWGLSMHSRVCARSISDKNGVRGSPCFGDSGGPLVCQTERGITQFGVISFIHAYLPAEYPVVFSEVSAYRQWILDTIS